MARTSARSRYAGRLLDSTALVVSLAGLAAIVHPIIARADTNVLPQGGTVVVGAATIKSTIPGSLDVTTATARTAIDWQSFSIGANNTVNINQPNASSLTLNQVVGSDPSQIFGVLHSNGQVVLANPNGIWFGPNSHVDVASIVASTATASTAALNAFARGGALMLDQAGRANAAIVNDGSISIGAEGLAGLVAPGVANNGIIAAQLGRVVLASGTVATLDFYGDGLISFAVGGSVTAAAKDQAGKALSAAVVNSGTISNAGGTVLLTAAAAKTVVDNTINMSGVVVASAVSAKGGEIDLDGGSGTTNVSGTLLASSQTAGGGTINVTGHSVVVAPTARLDVTGAVGGSVAIGGGMHGGGSVAHATDVTLASGSTITADATAGKGGTVAVWSDGDTVAAGTITATGPAGGGMVETSGETLKIDGIAVKAGSWLLDPLDLEVDAIAATAINTALQTGNVTLQTTATTTSGQGTAVSGSGNIDILAPITWSGTETFSLSAYHNVNIDAPITATGNGTLAIQVNTGISVGGTYAINAPVSFTGSGGTLDIDTNGTATSLAGYASYSLIHNATQLQAATNTSIDYALAGDIDLAGTTFSAPVIANAPLVFAGLGHIVRNVTLIDTTDSNIGFFGSIGSGHAVRDLTLLNEAVTGVDTSSNAVGGVVGSNAGLIFNVSTSGSVVTGARLGGIAGINTGTIDSSFSSDTLNEAGAIATIDLGGIAGLNQGTISNAYFTGSALADNSTTVGGVPTANAGGIAGASTGLIIHSYNLGTVNGESTGTSASTSVGGIVGLNSGTVTGTYDIGVVEDSSLAASYNLGGIAGTNASGGTVRDSYAAGSISLGTGGGFGSVGGVVGANSGTMTAVVWDSNTTGQSVSTSGSIGVQTSFSAYAVSAYATLGTTATTAFFTTFTNASDGTVWYMVPGQMRPILESEYAQAINNTHQLALVNLSLAGHYTLPADLIATTTGPGAFLGDVWNTSTVSSGYGFAPIGYSSSGANAAPNDFTGTFDGLGHTIFSLTISNTGADDLGLFSEIGTAGLVENVTLSGGAVTANGVVRSTGAIAGINLGTISAAAASAIVTGYNEVGGLVGQNDGTIVGSFVTASVIGSTADIGGLVGLNQGGSILQSHATGTINTSAATAVGVGGLVGVNSAGGLIDQSYATGDVNDFGSQIGGLVGQNGLGGDTATITNSYALGNVFGSVDVGGLVGLNQAGATIAEAFQTGTVNGTSATTGYFAGGNTGLIIDGFYVSRASSYGGVGTGTDTTTATTLAGLQTALPSSGFSIAIWADGNGTTRSTPFLLANAGPVFIGSTLYQPISGVAGLQGFNALIQATQGAGNYYLAGNIDMSGAGAFTPIGATGYFLAGTFEGLGYTISGLSLAGSGASDVGLFALASGTIQNLTISGAHVTAGTGTFDVGVLAGSLSGSVSNVTLVNDIIDDSANTSVQYAGLLAGIFGSGSTATGVTVTGGLVSITNSTGLFAVGGVIGDNLGTLAATTNSAPVTVSDSATGGSISVGGIVGSNQSTGSISAAVASGNVNVTITGSGTSAFAGGVVGANSGLITTLSQAANAVTLTANGTSETVAAGGFVGLNGATGLISPSWASGNVLVSLTGGPSNTGYAGGFAGENLLVIDQSFATGNVSGGTFTGGFVGLNSNVGQAGVDIISNSYATGAVTGISAGAVGGFAGEDGNNGTIINAFSTGIVTANGATAGGFVGSLPSAVAAVITNGYWMTDGNLGSSAGGTGLSLAALQSTAISTLFPNGSAVWSNLNNRTTPFLLVNSGTVYFNGATGLGLSATTPFTVITTAAQLEAITNTGDYLLGGTIDASDIANFTPIADFNGVLDGLGFSIANVKIADSLSDSSTGSGLFRVFGDSAAGAVIEHLHLTNYSLNISYSGGAALAGGGLVGVMAGGTLSDVSVAGTIVANGLTYVGGVVGEETGGLITLSHDNSAITVTPGGFGLSVGGLVGLLSRGGAATLDESYQTGTISGTTNDTQSTLYAGGLVGQQGIGGLILDSYALGSISVGGSGNVSIGGVLGRFSGGSAVDVYAAVALTNSGVGVADGLIAELDSGAVVVDGYWDTGLVAAGTGGTGLTLAALEANLPTFQNAVWGDAKGQATPYLLNNLGPVLVTGHGTVQFNAIATAAQLQAIGNLTANYVLVNDIDLSGIANFSPLGFLGNGNASPTAFTGTFEGLDFTLSHLTISSSGNNNIGLFSNIGAGGTVENLIITGASVSASGAFNDVGVLAGENSGTILNVSVDGAVNASSAQYVGGLVGLYNGGTITDSNANAAVTGATLVGGFAGSGTSGTFDRDWAGGAVGGIQYVGGFIGTSTSDNISDSYETGSVSASGDTLGGFVAIATSGLITNAFATGSVTGSGSNAGGFVGIDSSTSMIDVYWTQDTTGQVSDAGSSFGTIGLASITQLEGSLPAGFSSSNWGFSNDSLGGSTPYLLGNGGPVYIGSTLYQDIRTGAQLAGVNSTGHYVLEANLDLSRFGNFAPIGTFSGVIDGFGFAISNLTITDTLTDSGPYTSGLFRNFGLSAGAEIEHLKLVNVNETVSYTGAGTVGTAYGGLIGQMSGGTLLDVSISGTVTSHAAGIVGGLVGEVDVGTISLSSSSATILADGAFGAEAGDLIGLMQTGAAQLTQSFASGNVSLTTSIGGIGGGLVGNENAGTITDSYATGNVTGTGQSPTGALIGLQQAGASLVNAFALGSATGSNVLTGLIGQANGSNTNAFWVTASPGASGVAGVTNETLATLEAALPTGFSGAVWGNGGNKTTPYLLSNIGTVLVAGHGQTQFTAISTAAQLEAIGTATGGALSGDYVIVNNIDLSGIANWVPIGFSATGNNANPGSFTGVLDGLDFTLNGLTITDGPSANNSNLGLISRIGTGGVVERVHLTNATISLQSGGEVSVGLIAGINNGLISLSSATGTITAPNGGGSAIGGVVGSNGTASSPGGTIDQSWANVSITANNNLGNIAGESYGGTILDSYAIGSISGIDTFGGIIGFAINAAVIDAFAAVSISSGANNGAAIGVDAGGNSFVDVYWALDTVGSGSSALGTGGFSLSSLAATQPSFQNAGVWSGGNGAAPYLLNNLGLVYVTDAATSLVPTLSTLIGTEAAFEALPSSGDFALANNLDFTGFGGVAALGNFSGIFDGLGHTISHVTIADSTSSSAVGIFSALSGGKIANLTIDSSVVNILAANASAQSYGVLVGDNEGTISNITLTNDTITDGGLTTTVAQHVGLLAGTDGEGSVTSITESGGTISVTGTTSIADVGGIVGHDSFVSMDTLSVSNTTINVVGGAGSMVGGVIGYAGSTNLTLTGVTANGVTVSGTASYMGGIVGLNLGSLVSATGTSIFVSYAGGNDGVMDIGGLVGAIASGGAITGSSLNTNFAVSFAGTSGAPANVGGIAGSNSGTISGTGVSDGTVSLLDSGTGLPGLHKVGGLVGDNGGAISTVTVSGVAVTVTTAGTSLSADIGGAVGANEAGGTISAASVAATISAIMNGTSSSANAGGVAGDNFGQIDTQSFADGSLSIAVTGNADVGGLAGRNESGATILQSYAFASVAATGSTGSEGGFVGANNGGAIDQGFASGNVGGINNIGGFVGFNEGAITNSFAMGNVTGSGAGGFVGVNEFLGNFFGQISNSYALGIAPAGFAGSAASGTIVNSYWDTQTSGATADGGGSTASGVTTAGLQALSLGAAWSSPAAGLFPYLTWQVSGTAQAVSGVVQHVFGGAITPTAGAGVALLVDGTAVSSLLAGNNGVHTFADGSYYFLLTPSRIDGATVTAELTDTAPAAAIGIDEFGAVSNFNITYTSTTQAALTVVNDADTSLSGLFTTLGGLYPRSFTTPTISSTSAFSTDAGGVFTIGTGSGASSLYLLNSAAIFSLDQAYAGTLDLSATNTVNISALTLNANDTLTVSGATINSAGLTLQTGDTVTLTATSLGFTGNITSSGTTSVHLGANSITFPSQIAATSLEIDANSSVGTLIDSAGTLQVTNLSLGGSGSFQFDNAGNSVSQLTGLATLSNVTLVDSAVGGLTIQGLTASGAISISNSLGAISVAGAMAAGPSIALAAGTDIDLSSTLSVGGTVRLQTDGLALGGTVTGTPSGQVTAGGALIIDYHPTSYASPTDFSGFLASGTLVTNMLVDTAADLGAVATNLGGSYALNANLDMAAVSGFAPIGTASTPFTGSFDGRGHSISNLTIGSGVGTDIGLFGNLTGSVLNLTLTNDTVTGLGNVGMLAGLNSGAISNVTVTGGTVTGFSNVGGVIGDNLNSGVSGITSSAAVHGGIGNAASVNQVVGTGFGSSLTGTGPAVVLDEALLSGTVFASVSSGSPVTGATVGLIINSTSFGSATTDSSGNYQFLVNTGSLSGANELVATVTSGATHGALLDDGANLATGSLTLPGIDAGAFTVVTAAADLQTALGSLAGSLSTAALSSQISTAGIVTGSGVTDVVIAPSAASFSINAPITATGGTVVLTTNGGITQTVGAGITAATVDFEGSAISGYALTSTANSVASITGDNTAAAISLTDAAGVAVNLTSPGALTIIDTGTIDISSLISGFSGPTTLSGSTITFLGNITLGSAPTQDVTSLTATTAVVFDSDIFLGNAVTISAPTTDIASFINGAQALSITGNATFGGTVGSDSSLTSLTVTGTTDLTGAGAGIINTSGNISLGGALSGGANNIGLNASAGSVALAGVDTTGTLTVSNNTPVTLAAGSYTFSGGQFLSPITFDGQGGTITLGQASDFQGTVLVASNTILSDGAGQIRFRNTVDDTVAGTHALTVDADVRFDVTIGGNAALASLDLKGLADLTGLAVTTTGTQTYERATSVAVTTLALTGSTVSFSSTLDGVTPGQTALTITGNAVFDGAVGATTSLGSLDVTGTTSLGSAATSVTTSGAQSYGGAVTISAASEGLSGSLVSFGASLDGASAVTVTGNASFSGAVGGQTALTSLDVTGTTATLASTSSVTTSGAQTYAGAVTLGGGVNFTVTGNSGLLSLGTVNGSGKALSLSSGSGGITLNGATVGSLTETTSGTLTLNGGSYALGGPTLFGAATLNGTITLGQATNFGAVTLGSAVSLDSSAANGLITLGAVSGGSNGLVLSTGTGGVTLNGMTVASLALTTTGTKTLDAGSYIIGGTVPNFGAVTVNGTLVFGQAMSFGAVTLAGNATLDSAAANALLSLGAVSGAHTLSVSTGSGGVTLNGVTDSGLTLTTTGTTILNAGTYSVGSPLNLGAVTVNGTIVFGQATTLGATTLGSNTLLNASAANALVSLGAVSGAHTLAVSTGSGGVTLSGVVDTGLTLTTSGTTTLNAGSYSVGSPLTLGAVTVNGTILLGQVTSLGATTLGSDTVLDSSAANALVTLGAVTGGHLLTVSTGTGGVTLSGVADSGLTLTTTGTTTLNAGSYSVGGPLSLGAVTVNGAIVFAQATSLGATTLGSNTSLDSSGVNTAISLGAVSGAHSLALSTGGGGITLNGVADSGLTLTTTGTTTLNAGSYSVGSPLTIAGAIVNGTIVLGQTTSFGATTLGSDTVLDASAANALVTLGAVSGAHLLTVSTGTGGVTLNGVTDSGLTLTTSGTTTLNGGSYAVGGPLTLAAVTVNGTIVFAQATSLGATVLGSNTTLDSSAVNALVSLGAVSGAHSLAITTGSGGITLNGVSDSGLTLTTSGTTTLNAGTYAVGGPLSIGIATLNGSIVLGQATSFGATTLGSNVTLDASAANALVTLGAVSGAHTLAVSTGSGGITLNGVSAPVLTLTTTGIITLNAGAYTIGAPLTLGAVTLNGTITLSQATTLGAVTLGSAVTLDSHVSNAAITLGAVTGGANALTVTAGSGSITLNGITTSGLMSLSGGSVILDAGSYTFSGGALGAVTLNGGGQTISFGQASSFGAVTLASDTVLSGGFSFFSPVDGAHALTISGNAVFQDAVGGTTALTSLHVTGATSFAASGGAVTTTGAQSYDGAVTLNAAAVLSGASVSLGSTASGSHGLSVNGAVQLDGNVTTTGAAQTYGGAVTLGADVTLTGTTVTFAGAVDGAHALSVAGGAVFDGAVGGTTSLTSLAVSGTTAINAPSILTSGTQSYVGAVTFTAATPSLIGSTISLGSTLDGAGTLSIDGSANIVGAIGATTALAGFNVVGGAVSIGAIHAGAITLLTNALAVTGAVQANSVVVDTLSGGGTIALGTATGTPTLALSAAVLTALGGATTVAIGDLNASVTLSGVLANLPANLTILGAQVTADATTAASASGTLAVDLASGGSFTEQAGASITFAGGVTIAPTTGSATITIDGVLDPQGITLNAGAGGGVVLGSNSSLTGGFITITTDALSIGSQVAVNAATVLINGASPAIVIGTGGSGTLTLSSADLATLAGGASGTNALTIGSATATITVLGSVVLPSNVALVGASVQVASAAAVTGATLAINTNNLSAGTGSSVTLTNGASIDTGLSQIDVNGTPSGSALNLTSTTLGAFSTPVLTIGSSTNTLTIAGNVAATTGTTVNIASAQTTISPNATISGHYSVGSVSVNGTIFLGGNTVIDSSAQNGSISVTDIEGTGSGGQSLTITAGGGNIAIGTIGGSVAVGNVVLSTTGAGSQSIGAVTSTGSLAIADTGALTLGSVTTAAAQTYVVDGGITFSGAAALSSSAGAISFATNAISAPASVTASAILLETTAANGTVSVGTGTSGLVVSQALLSAMHGSSVVIGDGTTTIAVDGTLSLPANLILDGASVTLGTTAAVTGAGNLTFATNTLAINGAAPLQINNGGTVFVQSTNGNNDILLADGVSGSGLVINSALLGKLGSGPVVIGSGSADITQAIALPGNVSLLYASLNSQLTHLAGIAYAGFGATAVLANVTLDIVFDGHDFTTTTNSLGQFSSAITGTGAGHHDAVIVLTGGGTGATLGSAFYDFTGATQLAGLNVYGATLFVSGDGTATATALGNLATQISALTTGAGHVGVPQFSASGIATNNTNSLIIDVTGGTAALTLPGITSAGAVTVIDSAGIILNGVTASALGVTTNATTTLNAGTYAIGSGAFGGAATATLNNSVTLDRTGSFAIATLSGNGPINIGTATGSGLNLTAAQLASFGANTELLLGDGSNTITASGTIALPGGLILNGPLSLAASTEIDANATGADLILNGGVTPANNTLSLTLGAGGDIFFGGTVAAQNARLHQLTITTAHNVTVVQAGINNGATNATLWVDGFNAVSVSGLLSVGQHSLESDGDVAIFATAVDGRIVAGNNASVSAGTITNSNVSAGNIQVAAVTVSDSTFTSTRSANVSASQSITDTTISAPVANISTSSISGTTVTGTNITVTAQNYSGNSFNSPNPPNLNGGDPSRGGNHFNGQPVSSAVVQLASLNVPSNTRNPKFASNHGDNGQSGGGGDDSSGNGGDDRKKDKNAKNAKSGKNGKTYDYANQYVEKLLNGGKSKPE